MTNIPAGWKIERRDRKPFKQILLTAPNGWSAVVDSTARNPENILYMLAESLLTAGEQVDAPASDSLLQSHLNYTSNITKDLK